MGHFYLGQEFSEHNTQQKQKVHIYKGLVVYDKQYHVTCTVKQDFTVVLQQQSPVLDPISSLLRECFCMHCCLLSCKHTITYS